MKVALSGWFWPRPETGSGQYLRHLLRALSELADAPKLWLIAPPEAVKVSELPKGLSYHPLPLPPLPSSLAKVWWEQVILPRQAARLGVDLLHIPYWAPPMRSPVPTVVTVHDIIPLLLPDYRGGVLPRLYTALVAATSRGATHLITDSEASRSDILSHLHIPAAQVTAIPLAADATFSPHPTTEDEAIRRRLGVDRRGYILYLGGFDRRKNLAALFAAFAIVHEALPESHLVIAGKLPRRDSPFTPDPRRLMAEVGVDAEAVSFPGFIPEADKPALYRGAQLFAYPSRYEGFGLPPLEAMVCGVPVVGSDAASLPEVIGMGGILTAPDEIDAMAGAMIQLLIEEPFYAEMRRAALTQARRFAWAETARRTAALYASLAAR